MGGYFGSPKITLKNNKDLLGEKNKLTRKDYIGYKIKKWEDPIQATPEVLEEIKTRLQAENNKNKKQQIIILLLVVLLVMASLFYLY